MKPGDMVEINTGHTGIIVGVEYMYPGHPQSPLRNIEVLWSGHMPHHAFRVNEKISTVDVFTVKKVISCAEG